MINILLEWKKSKFSEKLIIYLSNYLVFIYFIYSTTKCGEAYLGLLYVLLPGYVGYQPSHLRDNILDD